MIKVIQISTNSVLFISVTIQARPTCHMCVCSRGRFKSRHQMDSWIQHSKTLCHIESMLKYFLKCTKNYIYMCVCLCLYRIFKYSFINIIIHMCVDTHIYTSYVYIHTHIYMSIYETCLKINVTLRD